MAARGSFQKRQKEASRREKRQLKLDRRQGRQPAHGSSTPEATENGEAAVNPEEANDNPSVADVVPGTPLTGQGE